MVFGASSRYWVLSYVGCCVPTHSHSYSPSPSQNILVDSVYTKPILENPSLNSISGGYFMLLNKSKIYTNHNKTKERQEETLVELESLIESVRISFIVTI